MKKGRKTKRRLMVSTDVGLFCTPFYLKDLYGEGIYEVEVIGWRWAENFLKLAKDDGITPVRLHGRIGYPGPGRGLGGLRALGLQTLLMSSPDLINLGKRYGVKKLLVHTGEARRNFEQLIKFANGMEICVENSLGGEVGLEATFEMAAKFEAQGLEASVVGDVGHYGLEIGQIHNPEKLLGVFLEQMDRGKNKYKIKTGAHLPIHAEQDEGAVNIDIISDVILSKFIAHFDEIVVENRADLKYEFFHGVGNGYKLRSRRRWQRLRELAEGLRI